jgi:transposase-like protein
MSDMICPRCGKNAKTLEVRKNADGSIRQRYECQRLHRFTLVDGVILTDEQRTDKKRASIRKANIVNKTNRAKGNP